MLSLHQLLSVSVLRVGVCKRWREIRWLLRSAVTEGKKEWGGGGRISGGGLLFQRGDSWDPNEPWLRSFTHSVMYAQQRPSLPPVSSLYHSSCSSPPSTACTCTVMHRRHFQMSYLHHCGGRSWVRAFDASHLAKAADRERWTGPRKWHRVSKA